jgi:hypothetical protein
LMRTEEVGQGIGRLHWEMRRSNKHNKRYIGQVVSDSWRSTLKTAARDVRERRRETECVSCDALSAWCNAAAKCAQKHPAQRIEG